MHVPQGSMPKSFMSPSCLKFHSHLKIRHTQLNSRGRIKLYTRYVLVQHVLDLALFTRSPETNSLDFPDPKLPILK